jgi:hypothetical protein
MHRFFLLRSKRNNGHHPNPIHRTHVEIADTRRVFFKHRDNLFFRSFTYVVSMTVTQIPVTILETFLYTIPVFFLANLYPSAESYFTLWLICFITSCALGSTFRSIAAFSKVTHLRDPMLPLPMLSESSCHLLTLYHSQNGAG